MYQMVLICLLTSIVLQFHVEAAEPCPSAGNILVNDCCQSKLSECLSRKEPCPTAVHLESFRAWLSARELKCDEITDAVAKRYHLLTDTLQYPIDRAGFEVAGVPEASLNIVVYVSMTCSLCKRLYDELLDSLEISPVGKSVNVIAKPFTTNEVDRLFTATAFWKKQSSLLRAIRPVKERITPELVYHITDSLGIPRDELVKMSSSSEITDLVKKSRDEGIRNGVSVTPTFFVNNIRYSSYKDITWILDYLRYLREK
jgi:protein-disulfide isomerase